MPSTHPLSSLLNLTPAEEREFDVLEKRLKEAEAWANHPAMSEVPHPIRLAATPSAAARFTLISLAEPRNQPLVLKLWKEGLATTGIYDRLLALNDQRLRFFHAIHGDTHRMHGGFGQGVAGPMMHWARFSSNAGPALPVPKGGGLGGRCGLVYTFSDELVDLMHNTKVSAEIPISELKLPSSDIYIQLGTTRTKSPFTLFHPESGEHFLEGAYVSRCHQADGTTVLEVTLTGSPLGKSGPGDDAVEWMSLYTDDKLSIKDALERAFTMPDRLFDPAIHGNSEDDYFRDQERLRAQAAATVPKLELIAKCLLFLGLPDVEQRDVLDGAEARKVLMRAQSGAHRRKAARGVALSYDTVSVRLPVNSRSEMPAAAVSTDGCGRTVAPHWRSFPFGHLKTQRYGPGYSLSRIIWVKAVHVNSHLLPPEASDA
jgi:hypothetical protein